MVLLAVLAGHAELAAVDGDVHLRHGMLTACSRRCSHRFDSSTEPDVLHRGIDPAGDVAVGGFELPRLRASWPSRSAASLERSAPARGPARPALPARGRCRSGARPRRRARPAPRERRLVACSIADCSVMPRSIGCSIGPISFARRSRHQCGKCAMKNAGSAIAIRSETLRVASPDRQRRKATLSLGFRAACAWRVQRRRPFVGLSGPPVLSTAHPDRSP